HHISLNAQKEYYFKLDTTYYCSINRLDLPCDNYDQLRKLHAFEVQCEIEDVFEYEMLTNQWQNDGCRLNCTPISDIVDYSHFHTAENVFLPCSMDIYTILARQQCPKDVLDDVREKYKNRQSRVCWWPCNRYSVQVAEKQENNLEQNIGN